MIRKRKKKQLFSYTETNKIVFFYWSRFIRLCIPIKLKNIQSKKFIAKFSYPPHILSILLSLCRLEVNCSKIKVKYESSVSCLIKLKKNNKKINLASSRPRLLYFLNVSGFDPRVINHIFHESFTRQSKTRLFRLVLRFVNGY